MPPAMWATGSRARSSVIASASRRFPAINIARNRSIAAIISGGGCFIGPMGWGPMTLARFPRSGIGRASAFSAVMLKITPRRTLVADVFRFRDHPLAVGLLPPYQEGERAAG